MVWRYYPQTAATFQCSGGHGKSTLLMFWNLHTVFKLTHKPQFWQLMRSFNRNSPCASQTLCYHCWTQNVWKPDLFWFCTPQKCLSFTLFSASLGFFNLKGLSRLAKTVRYPLLTSTVLKNVTSPKSELSCHWLKWHLCYCFYTLAALVVATARPLNIKICDFRGS